jgi:biotin synthase
MSDETQALCFMAGANSMFYGGRLLTTDNPDETHDDRLFARLGIQPEAPRPACSARPAIVESPEAIAVP